MAFDKTLLDRVVPEAPTEAELHWKQQISEGDLALWITKLELICEEAKDVLVRTALSPVVQAQDCIVGLYTARGDLCLASVGTYLHVCTGPIPCKYILENFGDDPSVGIKDGDTFFCNEILTGGFHNPDQLNVMPIFYEGELIAWAVSASHEPETGGAEPGGYAPNARSRYEEGLKSPPIKIGENFELKSDLMGLIANMVRDERMILNDMRARSAACLRLRQRILEVLEARGKGFLIGLMRRIIDDATKAARERIAQFHDGVYRGVRFFDNRGNAEGLGVVHVALHKKGDQIEIDLTGSSPATRSYFNSKPHVLRGLFMGEQMMFLLADLPASGGLMAPFKFRVPEGTLLNAPNDYAMSGSMGLTGQVVNAITLAMDKMIFSQEALRERACTPHAYCVGALSGGGGDQYGQVFSFLNVSHINAAGAAAGPRGVGMDAAQFWFSGFADSGDIEHEEVQWPFLYLFRKIMQDSGGAGKFRGGYGTSIGYVYRHNTTPIRMMYGSRPARMPCDVGLMGGYGTELTPFLTLTGIDWQHLSQSTDDPVPTTYQEILDSPTVNSKAEYRPPEFFAEGEGTATTSPGTSGFGDPLEADPEQVTSDVAKGITSPSVARSVYNVVYDEATLEPDLRATEELRRQTRAQRLRRGSSFDAFERDWLKRRPPEAALAMYGPWPRGIE